VAEREGRGSSEVDELIAEVGVDVVPTDVRQVGLAFDGFRRFGKGRHPAGLNFGDLFAYALAKAGGEPLLFKGDDFGQTDVESAIK
jgi:ribonuclease VapC